MGAYHYKNGTLHIENVALSRIADEVGTPVYCYSFKVLNDNYHALSDALRGAMPAQDFLIAYACKAGSNIALMKALGDVDTEDFTVGPSEVVTGTEIPFAWFVNRPPDVPAEDMEEWLAAGRWQSPSPEAHVETLAEVQVALDRLRPRGLTRVIHPSHGARQPKYRQVLDEVLAYHPEHGRGVGGSGPAEIPSRRAARSTTAP